MLAGLKVLESLTPFQRVICGTIRGLESVDGYNLEPGGNYNYSEINATVCILRQLLIHSIAGSVEIYHLVSHESTDFILERNKGSISREEYKRMLSLIDQMESEGGVEKDEGVGDLVDMLKKLDMKPSRKR